MTVLRFDIRHPDGRTEALVVEGERILIGHGAHCEIRLPLDRAALEHIVIEAPGGVVRAEARAYEPPATINGVPFTEAQLAPDSVLSVGGVEMRVAPGAAAAGEQVV